MVALLEKLLLETGQITLLVGVMMVAVDLLNIWTKRRVGAFLQGKSRLRQYVVSLADRDSSRMHRRFYERFPLHAWTDQLRSVGGIDDRRFG